MSNKTKRYLLPEEEIPHYWYNIQADMANKPMPPLHPGTKQPLKAVSFLQMLYSEEVLSGKGIELEDRREASNIRFPQGVSIYKKELEKRMRSLSRQDQKQIKTIQEEVNTVRFYSVWDRELNSLLSKYEAQEDEKQKEHVFIKTIQKWKGKIQK